MVPWACLSYRTDSPLSWDVLSRPIFLEISLPPLILVILLTYVNHTDTVSSALPQNYLPDCVSVSIILCCISFIHSPSQVWEFLEDGNFVLLIFLFSSFRAEFDLCKKLSKCIICIYTWIYIYINAYIHEWLLIIIIIIIKENSWVAHTIWQKISVSIVYILNDWILKLISFFIYPL